MSENKKSKSYTFSVDQTDPRYDKLIEFLDTMEKGARSFIIRQILNSYINGQNSEPLFGLFPQNQNTSTRVQEEEVKQEGTKKEEVVEDKTKSIETTPKKPTPPQLKNLKNQFGQ